MSDLRRLERAAKAGDRHASQSLMRAATRAGDGSRVALAIEAGAEPDNAGARLAAWHVGEGDAWRVLAALPGPPRCYREARHLQRLAMRCSDARVVIGRKVLREVPLLSATGEPDCTSCQARTPRYWLAPNGAKMALRWGRQGVFRWLATCARWTAEHLDNADAAQALRAQANTLSQINFNSLAWSWGLPERLAAPLPQAPNGVAWGGPLALAGLTSFAPRSTSIAAQAMRESWPEKDPRRAKALRAQHEALVDCLLDWHRQPARQVRVLI